MVQRSGTVPGDLDIPPTTQALVWGRICPQKGQDVLCTPGQRWYGRSDTDLRRRRPDLALLSGTNNDPRVRFLGDSDRAEALRWMTAAIWWSFPRWGGNGPGSSGEHGRGTR